jgi:NodT family efflux transporter outer membrane factor (OMF) lipoprotein
MKRTYLILVLTITLAGCAVGPNHTRPVTPMPDAWKADREWREGRPADDKLRGAWWERFGDATLSGLVARIDVANESLRVAEANLRRAQALSAQAQAGLFPTISANAQGTRSRSPSLPNRPTTTSAPVTTYNVNASASWEPDLWGRVRRSIESSEASAQAGVADLANVRLAQQTALAQNYLALRIVDSQRELLEDTVAGYERSLTLTTNQYNAGVVSKADVVQAQTQLKSTQAQLIDLGVRRAQLEHAIAIVVGEPPARFSIARTPASTDVPPIPVEVPSALLERRPDIAAAERRVAAANAQIGVAQAAFFPALTLSGARGYQSTSWARLFDAPAQFWSLGPQLAQVLFDGGLRKAVKAEAQAGWEADVATYRQTVLTAFAEVEDNLAALRVLEEEAQVQREALEAARQSLAIVSNQYKAGIVSFLNVIVAQQTALANERTAVELLGRRLDATVQLVRALGGGWEGL